MCVVSRNATVRDDVLLEHLQMFILCVHEGVHPHMYSYSIHIYVSAPNSVSVCECVCVHAGPPQCGADQLKQGRLMTRGCE